MIPKRQKIVAKKKQIERNSFRGLKIRLIERNFSGLCVRFFWPDGAREGHKKKTARIHLPPPHYNQ
jgi:hypothetical protein